MWNKNAISMVQSLAVNQVTTSGYSQNTQIYFLVPLSSHGLNQGPFIFLYYLDFYF
jgi:hypothetical protein